MGLLGPCEVGKKHKSCRCRERERERERESDCRLGYFFHVLPGWSEGEREARKEEERRARKPECNLQGRSEKQQAAGNIRERKFKLVKDQVGGNQVTWVLGQWKYSTVVRVEQVRASEQSESEYICLLRCTSLERYAHIRFYPRFFSAGSIIIINSNIIMSQLRVASNWPFDS